MIIHTKENTAAEVVSEMTASLKAISFQQDAQTIIVTSSSLKEVPSQYAEHIDEYWVMESDIQLASKSYLNERRNVQLGNTTIGGNTNNTMVVAGPCSVESEEQIEQSAVFMDSLGVHGFRGGAFKPRTSPYSFQGLGKEGLQLLAKMRDKYGFVVFSEVRDATHVADVIEYADVIQIGAKSMYDHGILRACAQTRKPVMIKRGFGTSLQEFVQAAEFVLSGGNPNVILCERGIRTFETKTRFTLDLCGVAWLKENTNLPIILDPSHALGYRYGISDLSKACMAMGIDGLLIEVHPNPAVAKSDASQQLYHDQFKQLLTELEPVANAVNRNLV